jgi:hypothetical protein
MLDMSIQPAGYACRNMPMKTTPENADRYV